MQKYNKLVRDKIPKIILQNGQSPRVRTLRKGEYKIALLNKLVEEAMEVKSTKRKGEMVRELGDVEEVIHTILEVFEVSRKEVNDARMRRKRERGGFTERIFLEKVL